MTKYTKTILAATGIVMGIAFGLITSMLINSAAHSNYQVSQDERLATKICTERAIRGENYSKCREEVGLKLAEMYK